MFGALLTMADVSRSICELGDEAVPEDETLGEALEHPGEK